MELELIIKVITIVLLTGVKFLFGPTLGYAAGFPLWATITISIVGMMLSVVAFTYVGDFLRNRIFKPFLRKRKLFNRRNRILVKIWRKYGVIGVALLTPVLFTPIPGTIVLTSFNTPHSKIVYSMLLSAIFWSFFFCIIIYKFGEAFLPF